jgi:hypothetical protein
MSTTNTATVTAALRTLADALTAAGAKGAVVRLHLNEPTPDSAFWSGKLDLDAPQQVLDKIAREELPHGMELGATGEAGWFTLRFTT